MSNGHSVPLTNPQTMGREYWDYWDYPSTLYKQKFGSPLDETKIKSGFHHFDRTPLHREWMSKTSDQFKKEMESSGTSTVKNDPNCFQVFLDVSQFRVDEVDVKTVGNEVVIRCRHEERSDEHGLVTREFTRKYLLPLGTDPEKVTATYDSSGTLMIKAIKDPPEKGPGKETYIRVEKSTETKTTTTTKSTNFDSTNPRLKPKSPSPTANVHFSSANGHSGTSNGLFTPRPTSSMSSHSTSSATTAKKLLSTDV